MVEHIIYYVLLILTSLKTAIGDYTNMKLHTHTNTHLNITSDQERKEL